MKQLGWAILLVFMAVATVITAAADPTSEQARQVLQSLRWVEGPTIVTVGSNAKFTVPADYVFLNSDDTRRVMELMENPSSGKEYYFGPKDKRWFGLFKYNDTGHVPDDEKIDADSLLDSIRRGTAEANKERATHGWAPMTVLGWRYKPFYDPATQRLEWAIDLSGSTSLIRQCCSIPTNWCTHKKTGGGYSPALIRNGRYLAKVFICQIH